MATLNQNVLRNYSHSCRAPTVEANGNDGEDVVDLDLLNEKDATLAQLGYKPVLSYLVICVHFLIHMSSLKNIPLYWPSSCKYRYKTSKALDVLAGRHRPKRTFLWFITRS